VARFPARDGQTLSEFRITLEEQMTVLDALFRVERFGSRHGVRDEQAVEAAIFGPRPVLHFTQLSRNLVGGRVFRHKCDWIGVVLPLPTS
jgi:hypothetical protein